MDVGPPKSFPIGTIFLLFLVGLSIYQIAVLQALSSFTSKVALASLILLLVYVTIGALFARHGIWGQLAFLGLGIGLTIFGDQVSSVFSNLNLHFSLVPLSLGPLALTFNGLDITWLLPIALIVVVVAGREDLQDIYERVGSLA